MREIAFQSFSSKTKTRNAKAQKNTLATKNIAEISERIDNVLRSFLILWKTWITMYFTFREYQTTMLSCKHLMIYWFYDCFVLGQWIMIDCRWKNHGWDLCHERYGKMIFRVSILFFYFFLTKICFRCKLFLLNIVRMGLYKRLSENFLYEHFLKNIIWCGKHAMNLHGYMRKKKKRRLENL